MSGESFHYDFSNTERHRVDENGKEHVYKICDACGREVQSNCGCEVRYQYRNNFFTGTMGLCQSCASKILPTLNRAMDEMIEKEREMQRESDVLKDE